MNKNRPEISTIGGYTSKLVRYAHKPKVILATHALSLKEAANEGILLKEDRQKLLNLYEQHFINKLD